MARRLAARSRVRRGALALGLVALTLFAGSGAGCTMPEENRAAAQVDRFKWRRVLDAALDLAAEDREGVDKRQAKRAVQQVATVLRQRIEVRVAEEAQRERPRPEAAARVVAQVLFEELGFSGDPGDPEGSSRERFDLDRVLIDRRGTCLAVTVVALAAAETAGMEVAPVLRPGHAMIAVPPGYLIDPATGGVRTPGTQDRIASPAELHADLLANRATYRRAQGDADGALQDVERALELAPSQATARANRAVLLLDLGRNEEAAADLELVEAAGQGSAQTAYNLGLASARLERMGVAKHWYGVATARDARYLKAWINLGALHETLGEPAAARQAYRAALGIDPDDAVARAGLERVGDAVPAD